MRQGFCLQYLLPVITGPGARGTCSRDHPYAKYAVIVRTCRTAPADQNLRRTNVKRAVVRAIKGGLA